MSYSELSENCTIAELTNNLQPIVYKYNSLQDSKPQTSVADSKLTIAGDLDLKIKYQDFFTIWTDPLKDFDKFLDKLNQIHPKIHFTAKISTQACDFLDLTIY